MSENKGKPSGKYAEGKSDIGRKGDYKRGGWPEDAPTQRVEDATGKQGSTSQTGSTGRGRNRKAGSPV